jgi:hypothetical protein
VSRNVGATSAGYGRGEEIAGARTLPPSAGRSRPDLLGNEYTPNRAHQQAVDDDPNTEILAAMSDSERAAYYRALFGPGFSGVAAVFLPSPILSRGEVVGWSTPGQDDGCNGEAYRAVIPGNVQQLHREYADELAELETRIDSHERFVAHRRDVATCVNAAGFGYSSTEGRQPGSGRGSTPTAPSSTSSAAADPVLLT